MANAERCVCCGEVIPEGRQVCPICEHNTLSYKVSKERGGRYFVHTNTEPYSIVPNSFGEKKSACKLAASLCGLSYKDYMKRRKEEMQHEDTGSFE